MMRYLTLSQVLLLHQRIVEQSGGSSGIRDQAALESALVQPKMTFEGKDLYPSLEEKAAALCCSLVNNHPFIDGNKRVGHAAMEVFLIMNGYEISADVDAQESIMLNLASGKMDRKEFLRWLRTNISPIKSPV
jgi:death-on-curing protein